MEPAATSFPGEKDPPQPPTKAAHLSEGQGPAHGGWARWAFPPILILLAIAFGWGLCQGYDLVFVLSTFYLAVWCFCLWMLQLDRRDHGGDPAAAARERQRFRLAAWAISLHWSSMAAILVVKAASVLALKIFLWVFAGLAMVLALYLMVAVRRSDSRTDDDGRWPEKDLDELSP
jgi:fatty acid desaturase